MVRGGTHDHDHCRENHSTLTSAVGPLRYGLPQILVSDNGPQFTAKEFEECMKANGVHHMHMRGAPYHPATNGEAEPLVQTFKQSLKRGKEDEGTMEQKLAQFLLMNHTTPNTRTGVPPAKLFMKQQLRTIGLMYCTLQSVRDHVVAKQKEQQSYHDRRARCRSLDQGQKVLARNLREGPQCSHILYMCAGIDDQLLNELNLQTLKHLLPGDQ